MRNNYLILSLLLLLTGCASYSSTQTETNGTNKITHVHIYTLFDANAEVTKLRTTHTDKSQGVTIGSVGENSSSTNTVEMLKLIGGMIQKLP